jgi:hypothetical protein
VGESGRVQFQATFPVFTSVYGGNIRKPEVGIASEQNTCQNADNANWTTLLGVKFKSGPPDRMAFLTSVLDGDEWSASRPIRFTPREIVPSTHCIGGWVGPRASLDTVVKR